MAGKTDYSKLRKKFQDRQMRGDLDDRWWRPDKDPGTHKVRILPPPDGFDSWCMEFGTHYNIGSDDAGFQKIICPRLTISQRCPICEFTRKLWRGTDADKTIAKTIGARRRYASNVLILSSKTPTDVRLWDYGDKVWRPLNEMSVGSDGDVTPIDDPVSGVNIKVTVQINRTEDRNFPEYSVTPWEIKTSALPDKSVLGKLHNFVEIIQTQIKPFDEIRSILLGPGAPPASAPPPPTPPKTEEMEETVPETATAEGEEIVEAVEDESNVQAAESAKAPRATQEELVRRARAILKKTP